jgi:hypothetical protein
MAVPLINGNAYTYAKIVATILGLPIVGITEIDYNTKQEKTDNYGAGTNPVNRSHGRKMTEASITLFMEEVEAIRAIAPNRDLLDVPAFDITLTFVSGTNAPVTHVIKNCEFTEDGNSMKTGDAAISYKLPLIASHVLKKA